MTRKAGKKRVKVEKIGGFAGFGAASHLRSEGEVDLADLPIGERAALERLMDRAAGDGEESVGRDIFRYRLSWEEDGQRHTVEVGESETPESVRSAAKDRLV